MKILLAVLILAILLTNTKAMALTPSLAATPVVAGSGAAASFPLFAGAVGLGLAVMVLNVEGIPFPLCGTFRCYAEYPSGKNGG